ncbi:MULTISPECIES: hypothetical protein [Stenotrophomonas]|uniref:hypothetical protein n=1 Tax=Stenotrophomonas TaxID=40323 RepID=UPI00259B79BF|nr:MULTISPECIES: hypothetical protein [Stenotrophomonas]WNB82078.1 hypothetical protein Q9R16_09835 [Stenotrophomonas sp. 9]
MEDCDVALYQHRLATLLHRRAAHPFSAVLLNSLIDASPNGWLMQAVLLLTPFSLLLFLAFGWQRLRKAHAEYPILTSELDRMLAALIGNVKVAAAWFGLTVIGVFTLILAWVLLRTPGG